MPAIEIEGLDHLVLTVRDIDRACGIEIVAGPVARSDAEGPIRSLYCRDPDGNLIELANRAPERPEHG